MRFFPSVIPFCFLALLLCQMGCKRGEQSENGLSTAEAEQLAERTETERIQKLLENRRTKEPKLLFRRTDQTPKEILDRMVSVYKNARSYSDHGFVRIVGTFFQPEFSPIPLPCSANFEVPNKLRLEISDGLLTSDGKETVSKIKSLPRQLSVFPTPEKWSLETIFQDLYLDRAMKIGIPKTILRFPPQLILLFAADPLRSLVPEGSTVEFMEPQWIDDVPCDLIRIFHPTGNRIFWIGRNNSILYRFDYLVEALAVPEGIENVALIRIELADAEINREIKPDTFQMPRTDDLRLVREFQPTEMQLLGKKPENLDSVQKTPVSIPDGSEKTLESMLSWNGSEPKVLVFCFWTSWNENCREAFNELEGLQKTFGEDNRVRCLAINLDSRYASTEKERTGNSENFNFSGFSKHSIPNGSEPNSENREIGCLSCADRSGVLADSFLIDTLPTWVILTEDGVIEEYIRGPISEAQLSSSVREILAGGKTHEKALNELKRIRDEHFRDLEQFRSEGVYLQKPEKPGHSNRQRTAYPKPPKTFSLQERWILSDLVSLGNIGLLKGTSLPGGSEKQPLLLIPCDGDSLALVDAEGKLLKKVRPEGLKRDEMITTVRTGIDGIGKQYLGVSSISGHAVHVYDENFSPIFSYGSSTSDESNRRRIISDFRFADIYGNGTQSLLLCILGLDITDNSFHDSVSVVDFLGKEIWRDDMVESPFSIDSYLDDGKRGVYALTFQSNHGTLLKLDGQGKRLKPFYFSEERHVVAFGVDDLDGDGQSELAVILSNRNNNEHQFAVLDHEGNIVGQHPIPFGEFQKGIDPILAGDLLNDSHKEWIVSSPDGTVYVFDRMGKRIDSFAFGEHLNGLVALQLQSSRLLIVVDDDHLTAWEIVPFEQ